LLQRVERLSAQELESLRSESRQRAADKFSWQSVAAEYRQLLRG